MSEENNLRLSKRAILRVNVALSTEDGSSGAGRTLDVSTGGLCVVTEVPLPINTRLSVAFALRLGEKLVPVEASARVQWCMLSNYQFKSGLEFVSVSPDSRKTIETFVTSAPNMMGH